VASGEPFIVEDARDHPLVRDSRAVANGVVAYAGVPLEADGEAIGALCVIDSRPRRWSEEELGILRTLARSAMRLVQEKSPSHPGAARLADDPTPLLECLGAHLGSIARYEQLIGRAGIDLLAEASARNEVVTTFAKLGDTLGAGSAGDDSELQSLVSSYLRLENARAEATTKFADGEITLAEVEALIRSSNDSLAALRIAALDRGAEP
jgi:hypothetical protein